MRALIALLLAGCTTTGLDTVKHDVDSRLTYRSNPSLDYTVVTNGYASCNNYAASYQLLAEQNGYKGAIYKCLLKDGRGHSFFMTDAGEVLDNRQAFVGRMGDVGCLVKPIRVKGY